MPAAAWWILAIAAMVGMFAACVILVAVALRVFENALARRRHTPSE
jgi:hypothetical protein